MSNRVIVVGGGFFGCHLASRVAAGGKRVVLFEKEAELFLKASYVNQARVHGGYHYPRSIVTGLRSQANYKRFLQEFDGCITSNFKKYYAIASKFSKVNAQQFYLFCERIGAPISKAPKTVGALFNSDLVEEVFEVEECAFDARKLSQAMSSLLAALKVELHCKTEVIEIKRGEKTPVVRYLQNGELHELPADEVYVCVYSRLNHLLSASKLPIIPLRHELAEMAIVTPPPILEKAGITVMCGPFFSIMPFPALQAHSLSHVRYTPHFSWSDDPVQQPASIETIMHESGRGYTSNYISMLKDAVRYLPALQETHYLKSLWEVKTILPRNDTDDARPILLKRNHGLAGLTCIIGGKIDNVFDVYDGLQETRL